MELMQNQFLTEFNHVQFIFKKISPILLKNYLYTDDKKKL